MGTVMDPLFHDLSDGVCVSDVEGNILYLNPAAQRMLETHRLGEPQRICEILCARMAAQNGGSCAAQCPLRQSGSPQASVTFQGQHGPAVSFEWKGDNFKKVERWKNLRVRCLKMPTDLLGPMEMEKHFTLIEDATAAMELERHKEDWRNMIVHDLRTPLSIIHGVSKALGEVSVGSVLAQKEADLIEMSARNCQRMAELLDLFLDVAKLEAGAMPLRLEDMSLLAVVGKCLEEQALAARLRRIQIEVLIPQDLAVRADAGLLFRVIQNVLNNAFKFTPEQGRVTITAAADVGQKTAILRVKDTGPGIAAEELPFIFDRFYQARARQEGRIKGFGLGLTFCREALGAMGGGIEARSRAGQGSEFAIRLPLSWKQ